VKLGNASIFFISVAWISVAFIAAVSTYYDLYFGILAAILIATIATYVWLKNKMINPLKKISSQLFEINLTNSLSKRISSHDNFDEINAIAKGINTILISTEMMQEKREEELNHKLNELQLINQELKRELSELRPIANRSITQIIGTDQNTNEETVYELPNRIYFNQILHKSFHHAQRHQNTLAILLLDICQFTKISSHYGEENAKKLLLEIGKRIEKTLRSDDVIAKLDNDEFIVLLNKIEKPQFASIVAGKLLQSISQLIKLDDQENIIPSANIGICVYPGDGNSLEELLTNLDTALYKAKSVGENTYQFYGQATNHSAHEYFQIESALHH
jgi:diguanylate cyclase (GGDEF)-like protein